MYVFFDIKYSRSFRSQKDRDLLHLTQNVFRSDPEVKYPQNKGNNNVFNSNVFMFVLVFIVHHCHCLFDITYDSRGQLLVQLTAFLSCHHCLLYLLFVILGE